MKRRTFVRSGLAFGLVSLTACGEGASGNARLSQGATRLYLLGTIHGQHRTSETYSLDVLQRALEQSQLDILIAEIPPDRIAEAYRSYRESGEVTEPRTRAFPEYTDVAFPMTSERNFQIVGAAGWTRALADRRRAALDSIRKDPARAQQWAEHLAAQRAFARATGIRRDDPAFIHTPEYDRLAEASRTPYQKHFDADLGAGGWTAINAAHTRLINAALDEISGQGLSAVITFGALHKYMILKSLRNRTDIALQDPLAIFS